VALVTLARQLARWGFPLIDCQTSTAHLASLGACEVTRAEFLGEVARLVRLEGPVRPWRFDADLLTGV
jgi:leucyl/phenylalanyl-tRNA--protein transferase